jgi:hypothetical protein
MKVAKLNHQISLLMNSIDFETLIVTIFALVDDWYQKEEKAFFLPLLWSDKSYSRSESSG